MKLSIIIPVYNVHAYIRRCLESCLAQDLPPGQFELVLVNDGSTDNSEEICREYAAQHPQVTLICQENHGQSVARNRGLDKARGEYVWFVDADDWIAENALAEAVQKCDAAKLDMLAFSGIEQEREPNPKVACTRNMEFIEMTGRDYLRTRDPTTCTPLYLFRRSFLLENKLTFPKGVFFEDEDFVYRSLYCCEKIGFLNRVLYYVNPRQDSTTRDQNPDLAYDLLEVSRRMSNFLKTSVEPKYRRTFHDRIALLLNKSLACSQDMDQDGTARLNQAFYQNRDLFWHLRKSSSLKDRIEGWLLSMAPRRTIKLFRLMHRL